MGSQSDPKFRVKLGVKITPKRGYHLNVLLHFWSYKKLPKNYSEVYSLHVFMSSQSIIFIICWRNCACCFKQFGLRDNRNNEGHRSPPCLLSIPLTACADLSSFFKTPFQYGVHTRKIKRAKEFFRIWFSAEAAKKWWVKINKMALHTSVCSVFLIIIVKMKS